MLNNVSLVGRITADAELKTTQSNTFVCSFTVAVDRNYTPKGEDRKADFINCVAWRSTAEFVNRYFPKGSWIAVTGSLQTRNYEDKNGNKRTATEVVVNDVSFCGGKQDAQPAKTQSTANSAVHSNTNYAAPGINEFEPIESGVDLPF